MRITRINRIPGITLVELLAVLAILAIILTFASAPLERVSARVDVDTTRENIRKLVSVAQRSAARHEIPVVISVSEKLGRTHLQARYSYRWRNLRLDPIPSYSLPPLVHVVLENGSKTIELREDGMARRDQVIRFYSEVNPEYSVDFAIEGAGNNDPQSHGKTR